ncbi:MAG TPA: pilus assembly protein CpaE [Nocardioides sp.]|uniref:pilus assembly protein CpaE n=1 Tax=Nocardioides sp. TaxID=35761 RepID=UPI002CC926EA|nr:pilus assembly protein CpaE [Nocardioides sp.]HQR25458.1 pilus assembly protein CpaE [Nocardioides sp.]
MITPDLARRLGDAGIAWVPANGDRFMVPDRDLDDMVFVVSEMVVEVQHLEMGALLRFNGTTEWALDSIQQSEVVWLPREEQLRALLGERFLALRRGAEGFEVDVDVGRTYVDPDAECAYARAVLGVRGEPGRR